MSTITTINGTDLITNSRTVINTNFSNLNTDKIETSTLDTDTALAANSDAKIATQKAVKTYIDTVGGSNASTTVRGIVEEATAAEATAGTATGGTGARLFINPSVLPTILKFGGTGADGALAISSGTTTLDLGGTTTFEKNYTSISITGTAVLTFTNSHANGTVILIRSQGAVVLTSSATPMINASGFGGGATGVQSFTGGSSGQVAGTNGTAGQTAFIKTNFGTGATAGPAVGTGGAISSYLYTTAGINKIYNKYPIAFVGAAGGNGGYNVSAGAGTLTVGPSGGGGAALIIECGGAWNFTTANGISVAGANGANATNTGYTTYSGGGSGGGGGGFCLVLYNSLTANSGTVNVAGGTGGNGVVAGGGTHYGGAGGASASAVGSAGTSSAANNAKTGGDGAAGLSVVALNS